MTVSRLLGIASISLAALPALGLTVSQRPLSVCYLFEDLRRYNGKLVVVSAVILDSGGSYTIGEASCPKHFITNGFTWPATLTLVPATAVPEGKPPKFVTKPGSFDKVNNAIASAQRPSKIRVTVVGEVRLRSRYRVVQTQYGLLGNGFGHLGASPALLIVKEIADVMVTPSKR